MEIVDNRKIGGASAEKSSRYSRSFMFRFGETEHS